MDEMWRAKNILLKQLNQKSKYLAVYLFNVRLFATVANRNKKIRKVLGLGRKENIVTCLAIRYPDVHYMRTVPRKKANIEWR